MDIGNFKLTQKDYQFSPADPQNSNLKGLMTTNYDQLKKDLQTPGDLQIKSAYDKADYTIRDTMGGGGLYGSSIHSGAISDSAQRRADSLAANAANAGATVAQLRSNENQWLGNAALDESRMRNTWNITQDQLNKALIHDILMSDLGNKNTLQQIDKQGQWGMNQTNAQADSNERNAIWGGAGALASGLLNNWSSIFG